MVWNFDAGPLHFGSDGVGIRPQMKVAYNDDNCDLGIGIDDVRDGLSAGVGGSVRRIYTAEGQSMEGVLRTLKAKSDIPVLDDIARIAPQLLAQIMHMVHVDIPPNSHVYAKVIAKFGISISGALCLGWADTKGFHMVGVRGQVSAAASIGADILAGLHHTRKFVKAVLGISHICVELVFELPEPAETGTAGTEGEDTPIAAELSAAADAADKGEKVPAAIAEHKAGDALAGAGEAHEGDEAVSAAAVTAGKLSDDRTPDGGSADAQAESDANAAGASAL